MKVLLKDSENKFYLEVIPRFYYQSNIKVIIREPIENETIIIDTNAQYDNGLLSIDLQDFLPVNDVRYSIIIKHSLDDSEFIIWTGQALYTEKDRQNYSMNNSDENKLRF